jgi:hypothetical protein
MGRATRSHFVCLENEVTNPSSRDFPNESSAVTPAGAISPLFCNVSRHTLTSRLISGITGEAL